MSNTNTNGPTAISPDHIYLPLGRAIDCPGSTGYIQFDSDGIYIGNLKNGGLGSGTVTIVTVTAANGVSAVVTNANTTPDLTFALGNITPTSVAASGNVTGANLSGTNTGDQTITLTGDVTGSGTGSFAATIANSAVTYAKIQNVSGASKLLGRGSLSGAGDVEEISIGSGLTLTGTTLSATGAGAGDVVGPASATDGAPALFDGTTGKLIKNSTPTGTGNPVLANSPTLVTPNLGTPSALVGTNITGTAAGLTAGNATTAAIATTVSVANEPSDTTCFVCVFADPTGNLGAKTNAGLTFNATTQILTAVGFSGPLTGNVTGNVSGSSGSCTGNAGSATVLQTARDINGVSFNGSASITITVPVATGITGLGSGIATFLATPSSANLASAVTDETGSGSLVFAISPTLTTPNIGTPSAGTLTNCSGLPIAGVTMATARLAGRTTAGSGSVEEITVGSGLSLSAGTLTATGGWATGILFASGSTTAVIDNSSAETSIFSGTIPANTLGTSGAVRVILSGQVLNDSGAGQGFTLRVKYGATTMYADASNATILGNSATRRTWRMEFTLFADGSASAQRFEGLIGPFGAAAATTAGYGDMGATVAMFPVPIGGAATEDSTADKTLDITVQLTAANASLEWYMLRGVAFKV